MARTSRTWRDAERRRVFLRHGFVFLIIFLVSSVSFALGYLAGEDREKTPIVIEACTETHESQ